jgi:hypothetical protein
MDHHSQLIEHHFIYKAPAPFFAGLERFHDRMLGRVKVFGGVLVRRRVATAHMAAGHAEAQVHPLGADAQAIFTTVRAGCDVFNLIEMSASFCHIRLLRLSDGSAEISKLKRLPVSK